MRQTWEWAEWTRRLAGPEDEDLAQVLSQVKVHTRRDTQIRWARDPRTRMFLDLGLHLLYEHHFADDAHHSVTSEIKLFRNLGPEDLMRHAARLIPVAEVADEIDRQRWLDTWRHHAAFLEDLIAYLFRPAVAVERVREVQVLLLAEAPGMTLGQLVREGTAAEIRSTLDDPTVGLQTFIHASLPRHPLIREGIETLETALLDMWASLYAAVFPAYGIELRSGFSWGDMAQLFDTAIEGTLLKARSRGDVPCLDNGDSLLAGSILAMLPGLCDVAAGDIEHRTVQGQIHVPPEYKKVLRLNAMPLSPADHR
ncbi:hypothetical protein ACFQ6Q_05820 [Streptomyces sp. NPDC056437]|uniref:hypothetical protein n=1 Tax=Streptomyces sp. NPDC056437 TaxID=3345816 RepID=UPI0036926E68